MKIEITQRDNQIKNLKKIIVKIFHKAKKQLKLITNITKFFITTTTTIETFFNIIVYIINAHFIFKYFYQNYDFIINLMLIDVNKLQTYYQINFF